MHSTKKQGARFTRMLGISGVALLLAAAGCGNSSQGGDPKLSAKEKRSSTGVLQALTVKGKHFTPNGDVHVTLLMAGSGANASPYVEENVKADGSGHFTLEKKPVPCPQQPDYGRGSWTRVTGRDTSSGISGSAVLSPGGQPDCTS